MKLKFKVQPFQTAAVMAVADCFEGQPLAEEAARSYRIDPGSAVDEQSVARLELGGFRNADLRITPAELLSTIQKVQRRQNLPVSTELVSSPPCAR